MPENEVTTTKNTREILFYRDGANEVLLQNENYHSAWSNIWQNTNTSDQFLQSRCNNRSGLPREQQKSYYISYLGKQNP